MKLLNRVCIAAQRGSLPFLLLLPVESMASVESSLEAIQHKLINTVLPLAGIVGLAIAGISFVLGHENARGKLILAVIGAIVGFGAPSIISFIQGLVR